jgi:hypothetical protein
MATSGSYTTVHYGGDVTLVFGEAPEPRPHALISTPVPIKRDISDSLVNFKPPSTLDRSAGEGSASTEDQRHYLVVSSHALRLSSSVFRRMLDNNNMKEAIELDDKGHVTIPLPDDDAQAMTVICNIIHHRNSLVPTKIDVDFLHDIAVLADKYFMKEALKPTVTTWVRDYAYDIVKRPDPPQYQHPSIAKADKKHRAPSHARWVQSRVDTWTDMLLSAHLLEHNKLAQKAIQCLTLGCDYPEQGFDTEEYPVPDYLLGR